MTTETSGTTSSLLTKWAYCETLNTRNNSRMLSCSKKKPIRYKKLKPQTAIAISLWFWGLLTSPEFYCDWSDWPVRIKSKCSLFFDCTVKQIESLIVVHFYFTSTDFTVKVEGLTLKVTFCLVYFQVCHCSKLFRTWELGRFSENAATLFSCQPT